MERIDELEYNDFMIDFFAGDFPGQQLGQAFCTRYLGEATKDPDLYNETSTPKAKRRIKNQYVELYIPE